MVPLNELSYGLGNKCPATPIPYGSLETNALLGLGAGVVETMLGNGFKTVWVPNETDTRLVSSVGMGLCTGLVIFFATSNQITTILTGKNKDKSLSRCII